jgi:hypothetical protein
MIAPQLMCRSIGAAQSGGFHCKGIDSILSLFPVFIRVSFFRDGCDFHDQ